MRKHSIISIAAPMAIAAAIAITSNTADARAIGGWQGSPQQPDDSYEGVLAWSCFGETWGGAQQIQSVCNGVVWEVPLSVDTWDQTDTAHIYFYAPNHGDVSCGTVSGNGTGGEYEGTGYVTAPGSGVGTYSPGSVYVPTGGYLFVACEMNVNAVIHEVQWNQ